MKPAGNGKCESIAVSGILPRLLKSKMPRPSGDVQAGAARPSPGLGGLRVELPYVVCVTVRAVLRIMPSTLNAPGPENTK